MNDTIKRTLENLKKHNIDARFAANKEEALKEALSLIPRGARVGLGGSQTVREIGLLDALRKGEYKLVDQYEEGISKEENMRRRVEGMRCEFFISGTNAVTEDGALVNIDGMGNRTSAITFGPSRVIIVVGRNKIVRDVEAGLERAQKYVAPRNAKRFGVGTPCAESGECSDCSHPERICNIYSIVKRQWTPGRITVIIVDQDLGM
jgi:L-lactate utilization protein LutB